MMVPNREENVTGRRHAQTDAPFLSVQEPMESDIKSRDRRPVGLAPKWAMLMPIIAGVLTLAILLPMARVRVDFRHDGLVLKPAIDVFDGRSLYRDTFSHYGPLTTYLHTGFMEVFGRRLLALRVGTVLAYGVTAAILVATWRRFLPAPLVMFGFALWIGVVQYVSPEYHLPIVPWSSIYALTFQVLALYALIRATVSERPAAYAVLAGLATALTFWCRVQVGVVLLMAMAVCLTLHLFRAFSPEHKRSVVGWFLMGTCATHLAFVIGLSFTGSLSGWFEQNILWPQRLVRYTIDHYAKTAGARSPLVARVTRITVELFNNDDIARSIQTRVKRVFKVDVAAARPILFAQVFLALAAVWALARSPRLVAGVAGRPLRWGDARVLTLAAVLVGIVWVFVDKFPAASWAYIVPVGALALTLVALWEFLFVGSERSKAQAGDVKWMVLVSGIVAMSSWAQYLPLSEPAHQSWAIGPMIGVFAFFVLRLGRGRLRLVTTLLFIAVAPLLFVRVYDLYRLANAPYRMLGPGTLVSGMLVPEEQSEQWESLLGAINNYEKTHGKVAILNETMEGLFASLGSDQSQPTPFFVNWYGMPLPSNFEELRGRFISEHRPLIFTESDFVEHRNQRCLTAESAAELYGYVIERVFVSPLFGREYLVVPEGPGKPWRKRAFYLLKPGPMEDRMSAAGGAARSIANHPSGFLDANSLHAWTPTFAP
jgi:hypothetical protein